MGSNTVFLFFFVGFAVILTYAGYYTRRWIADSSDFILAGREVSLLINIFGVAAIGYAGTSIALAPGFAVSFGFWGSMAWSGIYSLGGLAMYGIIFANFIRKCGAQTLPEWLEMRYSPNVRLLVTITTIFGLTGIMANNVVSLAATVAGYAGWPLWVAITLCFMIILLFSFFSGLWAVTMTDFIQMILGLIAIPLFVLALVSKYGGGEFLSASWPGSDIWTAGFAGAKLPIFTFKYPSVLTFIILFAAFLVWGNNYYWLRVASCRSERTAKMSFVWAGLILVFIIYVPLALIGLYAAAANPQLFAPVGKLANVAAYGYMMKSFGVMLASFLLIGALAASISTAATAHIGATSTAVRDIYQRVYKPNATAKELLMPSKVILLLLGGLTWLLSYYPGGPVYLFAFANAWLGPPAVLVMLGIVWRRFTAMGAWWGILIGMGTMAVLTLLELMKIYSISTIMHVGVAGLFATLIPAVLVSLVTKPKYYGETTWNADPAAGERERVEITDFDHKVLELLRFGHESMAEITDALQVDSRVSNACIERLDRGGYIKRRALWGANFYAIDITEKGIALLPKLSDKEAEMAKDGLKPLYLKVLRLSGKSPEELPQLAKEEGLPSLVVASIISHLVRKGYLVEKGIWRRLIVVTEKGRTILNKYA
ncbi:sodium:solute symporter [Clostridiales bacterium PH28_bin88]|nr:sodium:solute symporter [Clostridiales bacterium PH28_bin88]